MDITEWTTEYYLNNESKCLEALKDSQTFQSIPMLNHNSSMIPNSSLVRFRGMIQDMLDPEFYLEKYTIASKSKNHLRVQDGRYRDTIVYHDDEEYLLHESDDNEHGERRAMFVLSVPGTNKWVDDFEQDVYNKKTAESIKSGNASSKRPLEVESSMDVDHPLVPNAEDKAKRIKSQEENITNGIVSKDYLLNSPIPDRPSKACMVKIYQDFDKYKLNTIVDVVGFLSVDPVLDGSKDKLSDFDDMEEHISTNPPPSLIPRIHAIYITELSHINPLLDWDFQVDTKDIYKDLLMVLKQCFFGDETAAYYLLSHLVSSVYARIDVEVLGRGSLNLYNLPTEVMQTEYVSHLYEIIELLLPASHYFPMTLDNMNTMQFVPKKDFKTNRLTAGLLQLAPQTHLVIDETRLETGQLQSGGIAAINNISNLISNQILKFDFQYYQLDFEMNVPVLVVSEGKSILPSDFYVPIHADAGTVGFILETVIAAKQFVKNHANEMRKFLTAQKVEKFNINTDVQEVVQSDLVQLRREMNLMPDDFHLFLNLSRLVGKSMGKNEADFETWEMVKRLEKERRQRIEALPKRKSNQPEL